MMGSLPPEMAMELARIARGESEFFDPRFAPEYVEPPLQAAAPMSLGERIAMATRDFGGIAPNRYAGGGTNFATGLLSGLAGGYSSAKTGEMAREEQEREEANKRALTQADRNYALAAKTHALRFEDVLARGRKETPEQAGAKRAAEEDAVLSVKDRYGLNERPLSFDEQLRRARLISRERAAGAREGAPPLSGAGESESALGIRWTAQGKASIASAQKAVDAALTRAYGDSSAPEVLDAVRSKDTAMKRDVVGQIRSAKTRAELDRLAEKIEAFYPEMVAGGDTMVPTVMRDKLREFGVRANRRSGIRR